MLVRESDMPALDVVIIGIGEIGLAEYCKLGYLRIGQ